MQTKPKRGRRPGEHTRPPGAGRKPGTAGRRLHLTIPQDVAAGLPENDNDTRVVIFEALREFFNEQNLK